MGLGQFHGRLIECTAFLAVNNTWKRGPLQIFLRINQAHADNGLPSPQYHLCDEPNNIREVATQ